MRRRMRQRGILPLAFAVLLTVAAGLSLVEEHAWAPAAAPDSVTSSDSTNKGRAPHQGVSDRNPGSADSHGQRQAGRKPGVGSRALTGHDGDEPAPSQLTPITGGNTGLDDRFQSLD